MKEFLDIFVKKRKFQQLLCVISFLIYFFVLKSEDSNKVTKRKDSIFKQEYKLYELFLFVLKLLEYIIYFSKLFIDNDFKDIKKGKVNVLKRKLSFVEIEINFFGFFKR